MILRFVLLVSAVFAQFYNYAEEEIMSDETRAILQQKMWSLNYKTIPWKHSKLIALMYV